MTDAVAHRAWSPTGVDRFYDLDALNGFGFPPVAEVVAGIDVVDSLYAGYGDGPPGGRGPVQDSIRAQGNNYLRRAFPRLDFIREARVVREWK